MITKSRSDLKQREKSPEVFEPAFSCENNTVIEGSDESTVMEVSEKSNIEDGPFSKESLLDNSGKDEESSCHQSTSSDDEKTEKECSQVCSEASPMENDLSQVAPTSAAGSRKMYTRDELATMDMLDLVRLLDAGEIEMDELVEACDQAAVKRKEEAKRNRDLTDPKVVMAAVKEEIADAEEWAALRSESARLRRGETTCADYYAAFAKTFVRLDTEGLFQPLISLLPDEDKRRELLALHGRQP